MKYKIINNSMNYRIINDILITKSDILILLYLYQE